MKDQAMSKADSSKKATEVKWLLNIEDHDYPAAEMYLLIIYEPEKVNKLSKKLKKTPIVEFNAKDLFRASQLPYLGINDSQVENERQKIMAGQALSPLLLIRDERNSKVIIADGYHRLCAIACYA
jgi:hypothetical protein